MPRLALTLAYDGASYPGWQTQPSHDAIQDHVERALTAIAGHPVGTICAGRTDAGVHALRQVVHFESNSERPPTAWVRGVNSHLEPTISVRSVTPVSPDFHARFSARQRRYRYLLHRSPVRHPLLAGRAGWSFRAVDVAKLCQAGDLLLGEHDFSAFRSSQCQAASPVRRLDIVDVTERGPFVLFTFAGNAFLHHMIRNIVGTLLAAGEGRRPVDWVAEVLESRDRRRAAPTFEASGLYLDGVLYCDDCAVPSWQSDGDCPLVMAFA